MGRARSPLAIAGALAAAAAVIASSAGAAPQQVYSAPVPPAQTLSADGPNGRFLLDGTWLFRFDRGVGLAQHFERSASIAGWQQVAVPNAWNANDQSSASFVGTAAWYRKDFRLPSAAAGESWLVRFESVNYRATVWLNGKLVGQHAGAFLPFELELAPRLLSRTGINRLVVRVDDRRGPTDLPPAGTGLGAAAEGGWWNYGGILRAVYLREVDRIDLASVQVLPRLPCPACPARIDYRVLVRNYAATRQRASVVANYGGVSTLLGTRTLAPGGSTTVSAEGTVAHPVLWWPGQPHLYNVTLDASVQGVGVAHYFLQSGIRSVRVSADGHLLLNFVHVHLRGVGLVEDSPTLGSAIGSDQLRQYMAWVKDLGATMIRSQYPLDPYLEELADQMGVVIWSEIPVYQVRNGKLAAIRAAALAALRTNVLVNGNHPSVIIWSIANELGSSVPAAQTAYIRAAVGTAHALDPTRPVGLALAGHPDAGCPRGYGPLDVLGLNDYFGWYVGANGSIADSSLLPDYLNMMHSCYPHKALLVTEFGAESDHHGPVEEHGTYEYQQAFIRYHLSVFDSLPFLSGAVYWALQEFRVRPDWGGGNPHPHPPMHEKGLISFAGTEKPAYSDVRSIFSATLQLG